MDESSLHSWTATIEKPNPSPIGTSTAVWLLMLYTIIYVAPFYVSHETRPSPRLFRDGPTVIQGRIVTVTMSCIICSVTTFVLLAAGERRGPLPALHTMGYYPLGLAETAKCLTLTALLFLGPLFEGGVVEGGWRRWVRLRGVGTVLRSWTGYRNYVAGPITEEVLFRSAAVPLFLSSQASSSTIIFGTPIIFGLAHIHHFYEFTITHPGTPTSHALGRSLFQFAYTTLFGAYATFLYLRTGSLLAVVVVHSFCNWMGLPRIWGQVDVAAPAHRSSGELGSRSRIEDNVWDSSSSRLHGPTSTMRWTIAYYVLLVVGAFAFGTELWALTESPSALTRLGGAKQ